MIGWPDSLVSEIARRRSVVFLGAGISMQSTNAAGVSPKGWVALLNAGIELLPGPAARREEIRKLIRAGDLLTACDILRDRLGAPAFRAFINNELVLPNFQPAPIHDSIIQLGSRIYATPNFDKLFETRLASLPDSPLTVKHYYENDVAVVARGRIPIVLKVHGTIDAPDLMVFTRADYTKARNDHWRFYAVLEALSITHTFIFLGCGFNDPDIKLLLEDHAFNYEGMPPHYFVALDRDIKRAVRSAYERNLNLKILEYSGDYNSLKPEIDDLVVKVNDKRKEIQLNRSW